MRYKQGQNREEELVLPKKLEDYVAEDNPARAIDVYVDSLDLAALDFQNTKPKETDLGGQPPYPPSALLKLYLYGYLNRIRSSRRLEQECHRNLEVIWLLQELKPTYKTIADFRKNNLKALKAVNRDFVMLCKQLGLYGAQLVHIDGSFFRGNASKNSTYTKTRLQKLLKKIDTDIETYLTELSETDKEKLAKPLKVADLQVKLKDLQQHRQTYQDYLERIEDGDETQVSVTDEDARLLKKNDQQLAGYNVQTAVDDKHKLLVTAEATSDGNDMQQLAPVATSAQKTLETNSLEITADKGS